MKRHHGLPTFSLQTGVLFVVALILVDLGVFWNISWQDYSQLVYLIHTVDPYRVAAMRLNTDFARYDSTLNMVVGLDAEAPSALRQTTRRAALADARAFAQTYRQAFAHAPDPGLRLQLQAIEHQWTVYQHYASQVETAMAAHRYRQALVLQDVQNAAATAALNESLARLESTVNAQAITIANRVQARAASNRLLVFLFQGAVIAVILGGASAIRGATRRLVRVLTSTSQGDFNASLAPSWIREHDLIRHALDAMRTSIRDTLTELRRARDEQDRIIAARTAALQQYATTVEKVLQSTQHTLKTWDNENAIAEIKQSILETLSAQGCVSLDMGTGEEHDRWGVVPWTADRTPGPIRQVLPLTGSTRIGAMADYPRGDALLVPWRPYQAGRSVLVILRDHQQSGIAINQELVDLTVIHAETLWTTILLFRETQNQAITDGLTNLGNRRLFEFTLAQRTPPHPTNPPPFQLVLVDMDDLKSINDREGHAAGDRALKQVARALEYASAGRGRAFRIGGDEFALLLEERDLSAISAIVAQAQTRLGRDLTLSAGAAPYPAMGADARVLFRTADWALYQAKNQGRERLCYATFYTLLEALRTDDSPDTAPVLGALLDSRLGYQDDYTLDMAQTARHLAQAMNVSDGQQEVLWLGTLLHDYGRLAWRDSSSPGRRPDRDDDPASMGNGAGLRRSDGRSHWNDPPRSGTSEITGDLLRAFPALQDVSACVAAFEERWDGSGPRRMRGSEIPVESRILAVVDAFFRFRRQNCDRTVEEAREWITRQSATAFDPAVVTALQSWLPPSNSV
ncbi:MAG: diguanylate cyclase domain-containing protein [Bacilli bacterium]